MTALPFNILSYMCIRNPHGPHFDLLMENITLMIHALCCYRFSTFRCFIAIL